MFLSITCIDGYVVAIILPLSKCTKEILDNSHISKPNLVLHSRAVPSVGGITDQLVQPQGEIPEEGRTEKKYAHGTKRGCF